MRSVRVVAIAAAALLVAGCSGSPGSDDSGKGPAKDGPRTSASTDAKAPSGADSALPALPAALTGQQLHWGRCAPTGSRPAPGGEWSCARLKAPLDYAKPTGATIDVALIRARARSGKPLGSLVFNFGGPGGSGVSMLPAFGDMYGTLRSRYDLVSFDPRGVGASEGIRCRTDAQVQAAESVDLTPDNAAEQKAYFDDAASFGKGCERAAPELLSHVSTAETARDMDLMREVLGDRKMHYFGISYGTELGGTYAHLFPGRVGRLVLDAVVDPSADSVGHAKNQALGFQRALDDYFTSRGQNPKAGTARITRLLDRLDSKPLPASGSRTLNQSLALTGIVVPLYSKDSWPALTAALDAAENGDGTALLRLADSYNGRDPMGHYDTQSHSQRAISCRDAKTRTTAAEATSRLAEFDRISPVFGKFLDWDSAGWCHDWPVAGLHDTPEVSAPGAAPVLVVGNTGDPATPYEGARRMADELGKGVGVELTWKGEGHGAYGSGSDCVDTTVNAYLLQGTVPKDGKVCS